MWYSDAKKRVDAAYAVKQRDANILVKGIEDFEDRAQPVVEDLDNRKKFDDFAKEVCRRQREVIADRVYRLSRHQDRNIELFVYCQAATFLGIFGLMRVYGPRHLINHRIYMNRPVPPVMMIGVLMHQLIYSAKMVMMQSRLWTLTQDYQYEIRRAKIHHVARGVQHLMWLEYVTDNVRQGRSTDMDIQKLIDGPAELDDPALTGKDEFAFSKVTQPSRYKAIGRLQGHTDASMQ